MTKKQLKDKAERKRLRDDDKLKAYAAKTVTKWSVTSIGSC